MLCCVSMNFKVGMYALNAGAVNKLNYDLTRAIYELTSWIVLSTINYQLSTINKVNIIDDLFILM